jgi:hypothetical protein
MKTIAKQHNNVSSIKTLLQPKPLPQVWRKAAGLLSRSSKQNVVELRVARNTWDKRTRELERLITRKK